MSQRCEDPGPQSHPCVLPAEPPHPHHTDGENWWPNQERLDALEREPLPVQSRSRGRGRKPRPTVSTEAHSAMVRASTRMAGRQVGPQV